jgi:hypothetical protein
LGFGLESDSDWNGVVTLTLWVARLRIPQGLKPGGWG